MAKKELEKSYGKLIEIEVYSKYSIGKNLGIFYKAAYNADFILVTLMGGLRTFGDAEEFLQEVKKRNIPLHLQTSVINNQEEVKLFCSVNKDHYQVLEKYILYSGVDNYINLFLWIADTFGNLEMTYEKPRETPFDGIYHPTYGVFNSLQAYQKANPFKEAETIGILFYRTHFIGNNLTYIDELISKIEEKGCNALPVFIYTPAVSDVGNLGLGGAIDTFFLLENKRVVNSVINTIGFSLTNGLKSTVKEENHHALKKLNVPILKGMLTTQSHKEWSTSEKGISLMDYSLNVVLAEYDGQITTFPLATKEKLTEDVFASQDMCYYQFIPERSNRLVDFAKNYGSLNRKDNKERKIAIIFHNYPPGDGSIGSASGLDAPESIARLLKNMQKRGYYLEKIPQDGQELIKWLQQFATNERTWVSEKKIDENAFFLDKEKYREIFKEFPEKNQKQIKKYWKDVPGEVLVYNEKIIIPGMVNGNIFIGMQPARGWGDDPSQIYHSPDLPPTHQYLAYYRWIRDEFKADAIIHVGTHGNLEWLPGKSVGLSQTCYPDLAISDLPHFYYYIIKNPGEGTQAKRRSYATIVDHMIPPLNIVEAYDDLEGLENKINSYYESKLTDESKIPICQQEIWDLVVKLNLDKDLDCVKEKAFADYDNFLELLHGYINEVKHTHIKEGMHILGNVLAGEELINMLLAITRIPNGDIPSLLESIIRIKGYDYDVILENRGKFIKEERKTYGQVLDEMQEIAKKIITSFYYTNFESNMIEKICYKFLGKTTEDLHKVLYFIATELITKLQQTYQEITNMLDGLEGKFIPPGPCGNISRGGANLLPTGRNFYTLDPETIPTSVAWEVGKRLGDALMQEYSEEEGKLPESVGMILWGTPNLRSKGDDIAEILYLLGLKPVWDKATGRVKNLKVIPLEKLGRPRIDVTIRISGLFRDTFPVVIKLLDQAFNLVASLDEPDELNFIAKHVREEILEKVSRGEDLEIARKESTYRIFGCQPGAYGTGVNHAVDTKEWSEAKDLADIYLTWGAYVYGKDKDGEFHKDLFKQRLTKIDVTTQNTTSRETDILDADDFYHYHGGLVNAVKVIKGTAPKVYCGDSSDPQRVKIRTAEKELKYVYRSRVLNPNWIESMRRHGYKGAADIAKTVDYSFGWDATAEVMDDWMYDELAQKFALDKEFTDWLKEVNPWALQNITERLLEAIQRGMWNASEDIEEQLKKNYLDIEGELESYVDRT